MPLIKGKSNKSFKKNVETEMDAGKPKAQSLAIAYNVQKQSKKKSMASGGMVSPSNDADEHYASIAEAILAKKRGMADGGMVDIQENGTEDSANPSPYDDMNADLKELYDDSQLSSQPMTSIGYGAEDDNDMDMVSSIRKKIRSKRGM